jgi:hypothetical protein
MTAVTTLQLQAAAQPPQQPPAPPAGSFIGHQVAAAVILVVLIAVAAWVRRRRQRTAPEGERRGGLVMGWDRRLSTSKTMALAWTVVLAFMVVTIGLIAIQQGIRYLTSVFDSPMTNTNNPNDSLGLYLVLLGGPYAAAVFAKFAVVSKVEDQRLQKIDGTGRGSFADLVGDDTGTADLVDFQYTLFNLIGLVVVLGLFCPNPGQGLPGIPAFLAVLLGGSALTYTVNKAAQSNAPTITGVFPQVARINESVAIVGTNLYLPADRKDNTAKTQVTVGGVEAPVGDGLVLQSDRVELKVPIPKAGTGWDPRPQDVRIKTTGGATADAPASLRIVDDAPYLDGLNPLPNLGERLTLRGEYFYAVGDVDTDGKPTPTAKSPTVRLEWADAGGRHTRELSPLADPVPSNTQLAVAVPLDLAAPNQPLPIDVTVSVRRDSKRSSEISVPFSAPPTPAVTALEPDHARVGQVVLISGTELSLEATIAQPVITVARRPADLVGTPTSKQVRFKVPPGSAGPCTVTLSKSPAPAVDAPRSLTVEPDIPQLDTPASPGARLSHPVSLSGRYFYAVSDLGEDGTPTPNPSSPPTVRIEWVDANNQPAHRDLPADNPPRPLDTQLTARIPADLVPADNLPLAANVSICRDNVQSNRVPITID